MSTEGWGSATAMHYKNAFLFVLHQDYIYKVNPQTGTYEKLGTGGWTGSDFMV